MIVGPDPARPAKAHAFTTRDPTTNNPTTNDAPDRARRLFRYLNGAEWMDYRAILKVFAGTFFAEFTADDIDEKVNSGSVQVDPAVIPERLESLRHWGNLTVSSSVGNPSSLEDYYRKRNRYLITRAGQEVFELVERVLAEADEIGDVQAGRLRDLNRALRALGEHVDEGFDLADTDDLTDAVRSVFDLHERFTTELTQFFAELNLWQSRYDLDVEEVQFFAGVLVGYVSEQLAEIERMTRPIAQSLNRVLSGLEALLPRLRSGLAERVDQAGLAEGVAVRRSPGTRVEDWEHLAAWFTSPGPGRQSRLDQLTRQAVAAVHTLTANLTRLSRGGLGVASKRSDLLRLAGFFDKASENSEVCEIAAAAFGLGSCRHLGMLTDDADDPAPTVTPWKEAPRAVVPVSLRERGDVAQRGNITPMRDRHRELDQMQYHREREKANRKSAAAGLLACADGDGRIDGAWMPVESFAMLRDLIGRSGFSAEFGAAVRTATAHGVTCEVRRSEGERATVACPDGQLTMEGLTITVTAEKPDAGMAAPELTGTST